MKAEAGSCITQLIGLTGLVTRLGAITTRRGETGRFQLFPERAWGTLCCLCEGLHWASAPLGGAASPVGAQDTFALEGVQTGACGGLAWPPLGWSEFPLLSCISTPQRACLFLLVKGRWPTGLP